MTFLNSFVNIPAMLKIRLQRVGRKNDSSFRVVLTDSKRGPKSGDNVELLGSYNPHVNTVKIDGERVKHWISVGAQVSDTVHNLLIKEKIIEGKKVNVLPKKSPIKKEEEEKKEESAEQSAGEDAKEEEKKEEPKEEEKSETEPTVETKEAKTDKAEGAEEEPKAQESDKAVPKEETKTPEDKKISGEEAPKEEVSKTEENKKSE